MTASNTSAWAHARAGTSVARILAKLVGEEPKDVAELVDKMLGDYQVQLCDYTIQALMKTVPVTISCEDYGAYDGTLDGERADSLADMLRTLWESRLSDMLAAFRYGRVAFEKVWGFDRSTGLQYLEDLEPLPFKHTELELNEVGTFSGITLKIGEEEHQQIHLEAVKSWWLAIDATAIAPHGKSRYLGAPHEVWLNRRKLFKLREVFINRCVLKGGVAHIPMGVSVDDQGNTTDESTNVEQAFENYVSGGLILLPNDRDVDTKQYKYDLTIPEGLNDPAPLDNTIDGSDVEQTRAFGIPEKTIMEGDAVGSYAMVSLQMLVLYAVVDDVLGQIVNSFQEYVIDKAVAMNFEGGMKPSISIAAPKLARQTDSLVVEIVKGMLTSQTLSPLVMSGAVDVLAMLEGLDVPISDDAQATIAELVMKFRGSDTHAVAAADPTGLPTDSAAPVENVAATAMNGAQIASLLEIIQLISTKMIPLESGRATITASFPALTPQQIQAIMAPLGEFTPAAPVPAPGESPVNVEPGESPPPDAGGGAAGVTLSNNPAPVESASLSRVPSLDELADEAVRESDLIWQQILKELAKMHASHGHAGETNVRRLLDELRQLRADMTTAAKLLGMVSLWKPTVNSVPDGFGNLQKTANLQIHTSFKASMKTPVQINIDPLTGSHVVVPHTVTLALPGVAGGSLFGEGPPEGSRVRFTFVEQAVQWVLAKKLATASDVSKMAAADKLKVFTAAGIDDLPTLDVLRAQVSDSLSRGESLYTFRKKLSDDLELTRAQTETLYRTNTKQAYDQGLTQTLEKPHVRDRFGYVLYVATHDALVRSSHAELDGLVAQVGSDLYKIFLAARADWNCRCGMIPLTYEQALARGVNDFSDLADEVTQKYAGAI